MKARPFNLSFIRGTSHDSFEIFREGADNDARSIDLKVISRTSHIDMRVCLSVSRMHRQAWARHSSIRYADFAQVSLRLLDVIFNFNWPRIEGGGKKRICATHPHTRLVMARTTPIGGYYTRLVDHFLYRSVRAR